MGHAPDRTGGGMNALVHEWRLLARAPLALAALALLLALSSLAVWSGAREIARQQATLARLAPLQQQDLAAQLLKPLTQGDAGSAAYYGQHATANPPSPTAFLALGLRDSAPLVLRVRALALQSQLHEGESFNPELALAGRFDWAFVLVYLAPLFLIALLYDLVSGERRAGRLATLMALPQAGTGLWLRRTVLRAALVALALLLPVLVAALLLGTPVAALATAVLATLAYLAFWSGLALAVGCRGRSPAAHATALMGCWALLTLVLPTLAHTALQRALPAAQGVELALAQRETVHGAWDRPREQTMERFFTSHPQWQDTAPLPAGFHWKWYFAFQQLGDEDVAQDVHAWRVALQARQRWTERLGWLLPGVGVQTALHRQAATDLAAQLDYQDAVADFHAQLRGFFYPHLFDARPFTVEDLARMPQFQARPANTDGTAAPLLALGAAALLALLAGGLATRRLRT
jgi:ABC-2 type transport system permease protein